MEYFSDVLLRIVPDDRHIYGDYSKTSFLWPDVKRRPKNVQIDAKYDVFLATPIAVFLSWQSITLIKLGLQPKFTRHLGLDHIRSFYGI